MRVSLFYILANTLLIFNSHSDSCEVFWSVWLAPGLVGGFVWWLLATGAWGWVMRSLTVEPWGVLGLLLAHCVQSQVQENTGVGCHSLLQRMYPPKDQIHVSCIGWQTLYH